MRCPGMTKHVREPIKQLLICYLVSYQHLEIILGIILSYLGVICEIGSGSPVKLFRAMYH